MWEAGRNRLHRFLIEAQQMDLAPCMSRCEQKERLDHAPVPIPCCGGFNRS